MCYTSLRLVLSKRYQLVHAVEEAVFIALLLKWTCNMPYVYDMDSSLVQQIMEKYPRLTPLAWLLRVFERLAVRHAEVIIPVCDALVTAIEPYKPKKVMVLHDPSLLQDMPCPSPLTLKAVLGINGLCAMYVGNLEAYQGIDLLLESFALVLHNTASVDLVIIGGEAADIHTYQQKARHLHIHRRVHFLGPQPVARLAEYLAQADILVSPRIQGQNTPMKLYSYLHSGKAILATDLPTHTQILHNRLAVLTEPSAAAFAGGWLSLIADSRRRTVLGAAGKRLAEEQYSYAAFREKLHGLFGSLEAQHMPQEKPACRRMTSDTMR
jgi:glycosyltransferase involved in cell wall biosynthesis